jgi:hypothetical protein
MSKTELEGELFVLVEETEDKEDVIITAEINGFNIWNWIRNNKGNKVKISLEKLE